ncbi:DUF4157 domain-containing protein [Aquimarina litoralis]|uniref:eCIS core domain-containing protein n=1 Tax=Aquimarina litoralis TaxID=584605 RepID=UPI001C59103D|nr:DUF4157 domain-containing protein [Aquimarina litoralis]MBW1296032.1 DUF4157 domain-containing protein [Aquimarina litoralis]
MYARDKKQDNASSVKNSKSKATAIQFKDLRPEGEHQNTISSSVEQSPRVTAQKKKMDSLQKPVQKKENKTGLPDQLKSGIESLSGMDMSDTRVHYNSSKPAQLHAHAYAQDNQIHVAPGQEKHVPHEAWHVVQQKQGRVRPTMQMKGKVNINDDAGLEREADVMGAKALTLGNSSMASSIKQRKVNSNSIIQGQFAMNNAAGTVPPLNLANTRAWILANCSPKVKDLINKAQTLLTVRWDNGIVPHASTTMNMDYTDATGAHNINLFGGGAAAAITALNFPLVNYRVNVNVSIKTGGLAHGGAPVAANAQSTWQATLVHELEAHTKLAEKVYKSIDQIHRKPTHEAAKKRVISNSINTRSGNAEHKAVATGGSSIKNSQEKAVLSGTTQNEKVNILIDSAWDRIDHMGFVANNNEKKLALRDIKRWLNSMARRINAAPADLVRIRAIIADIDARIGALP